MLKPRLFLEVEFKKKNSTHNHISQSKDTNLSCIISDFENKENKNGKNQKFYHVKNEGFT